MSDVDPADEQEADPQDDVRVQWAKQRRAEEFVRLAGTGYTVCCGGGSNRRR